MSEQKPDEMKIPTGKLGRWLRAFLDETNSETFLNRTASAKAAKYNATSESSFSTIGHENMRKLEIFVRKWLDESGVSEVELKMRLLKGLDAVETRHFVYQGEVRETRQVIPWAIRLGYLKLAMQSKGMLITRAELTGKNGGPLEAEVDHFVKFPSGPMTIEEWEKQCAAADEAKRKRDEEVARDR